MRKLFRTGAPHDQTPQNPTPADRSSRDDEHKIGLEELFKRLEASAGGLTTKEADKRLFLYGPNTFEVRERPSSPLPPKGSPPAAETST